MAYGPRSARTSPLPPGWREIRARILQRDGHACQMEISADGTRCLAHATDVDHIGAATDHSDQNLRALCKSHHRRRSAAQGGNAAAVRRQSRTRPREQHPGLLG